MGYAEYSLVMVFSLWCTMILIGFILFYFLKDSTRNSEGQEILDKRYSNGEINIQEYEEKSSSLKKIT
jgi:uncharacterized membrane protein